jgi:hypothetical protein
MMRSRRPLERRPPLRPQSWLPQSWLPQRIPTPCHRRRRYRRSLPRLQRLGGPFLVVDAGLTADLRAGSAASTTISGRAASTSGDSALHRHHHKPFDTDFRIRSCLQRLSSSLLIGPLSQMRAFGNPSKNRNSNSIPCHPSNRPDSANSLARRRTCSFKSRRFNRRGVLEVTNDNTPPRYTSATTTAPSIP